MTGENLRESVRWTASGQAFWDSQSVGSFVSSLEGDFENTGAIWIFCDPLSEKEVWAELLPRLTQRSIFTWSARCCPEQSDQEESGDNNTLMLRSTKRIARKLFQGMPFFEERYRALTNGESEAEHLIDALRVRSTGFAIALGDYEESRDSWLSTAQLMAHHFSLSRDFQNSVELELQRREIVSLYVRSCVANNLIPLIPLNGHPKSGFVLFCNSESYPEIFRTLSDGGVPLEGEQARKNILDFVGLGGDLAYT
ncbi:hypothetical protein ACFY9Q_03120 [Streptomyces sp. NPDC012389]|uniref:hypothetical protein n=1 Tax=unclassified Streptomyces TaxID=2593676 RepID=UPI001367CA01|nr:hypothetical protein [Streptomyces sp. SID8374]MYX13417.1 hypothetical protein [Streptomyces sp. SID8374]